MGTLVTLVKDEARTNNSGNAKDDEDLGGAEKIWGELLREVGKREEEEKRSWFDYDGAAVIVVKVKLDNDGDGNDGD
ncbi:uncharacterized protein DS421_17g599800 [Arachis hypogaea]|nr:uncharacterized protein DS421_17g599800 [Arachis hypogaea]